DDVGPEIGQHHARAGTGDERALLDHADSLEGSRDTRALLSCLAHGFGIVTASMLSWFRRRSRRRIAVVSDRLGGGTGHRESDRPGLLLDEVRDQAGGSRQQRYPFERGQRIAGIEQHRRYRAGYIERERFADQRGKQLRDSPRDSRITARRPD